MLKELFDLSTFLDYTGSVAKTFAYNFRQTYCLPGTRSFGSDPKLLGASTQVGFLLFFL